MSGPNQSNATFLGPGRYRIRLQGQLDPSWHDRLGGMTVVSSGSVPEVTILDGVLPDQTALVGIWCFGTKADRARLEANEENRHEKGYDRSVEREHAQFSVSGGFLGSTSAILPPATDWEVPGIWAFADFLHAVENDVPCRKSAAVCETSEKWALFERGKMAEVELGR